MGSVKDLINTVLNAQEQRVQTYREYDHGLDEMLKKNIIHEYPILCTDVTAKFSVVSDTMNTIQNLLLTKYGRKDLKAIIQGLQSYEKEKLNITAAMHLERIRARNQELELIETTTTTTTKKGGSSSSDMTIARLLNESIQSLRTKMNPIIENINESIEELRYARMEEDDEE